MDTDEAFEHWHMAEFGVSAQDNAMAAGYRSAFEAGRSLERPAICGARAWPYTENNICILEPHEAGDHLDKRNRNFSVEGYREKSTALSGVPVKEKPDGVMSFLLADVAKWRERGWPGSHYDEDDDCTCPDHWAMRKGR